MKRYKLLALITLATLLIANPSKTFASTLSGLTDISTSTNLETTLTTSQSNPSTDFNYIESSDSVTITGYIGTSPDVILPETINDKPVIAIGDSAFRYNSTIVNLTIPNDLTIGKLAFANCSKLTIVSMPNITTISESSFSKCSNLTTINIPNATTIQDFAFESDNQLTTVTGSNILNIGESAFGFCTSLSSIDLSKVTTIDIAGFYRTALTDVALPNVTTIDGSAFSFCSKLSSISAPKLTTIPNLCFYYCDALVNVDLPQVTTIKQEAFHFCTSLKNINLPLATTIENNAFLNCFLLNDINIPNITTIGSYAFTRCNSLNSITLPSILTTFGNNVFINTPLTSLTIYYGTDDISYLTITDWNNFVSKFNGLNIDNITGKYVKNNTLTRSLTAKPNITITGDPIINSEIFKPYNDLGAIATDNSGASIQVTSTNNININKLGSYSVIYTATDISGNITTATRTVNIVDTTAPTITLKDNNPLTITIGGNFIDPGITISDNYDETILPVVTSNINTDKVGQYTVIYTATDSSGNQSSTTRFVNVIYKYSDLLQPINTDGSSVFKAGSTIPVKFQLTDAKGNYISTSVSKLSYSKINNNVIGQVNEAVSTSAATTGNLFRYSDNKYIFNISTKGLTPGQYKLIITLDDGETYTTVISLK